MADVVARVEAVLAAVAVARVGVAQAVVVAAAEARAEAEGKRVVPGGGLRV